MPQGHRCLQRLSRRTAARALESARTRHVDQESNLTGSRIWSPARLPRPRRMKRSFRAAERIRTSANDLRKVVSRSSERRRGTGSGAPGRRVRLGDRNRTCGLVIPDHALLLLSYTQIIAEGVGVEPGPGGHPAFEAGVAPLQTSPSSKHSTDDRERRSRGRSGGS